MIPRSGGEALATGPGASPAPTRNASSPTHSGPAPWSAVSELLAPAGATGHALRHTPEHGHNNGEKLGSGPVVELARTAGPGVAVTAPIRPELVTVDLDGAGELLGEIEHLAGTVGGALVYLARSGSPDSLHALFALPTALSHGGFRAGLARLVEWSGVNAARVDLRAPGQYLRLPGSASLKDGGGPVTPITRNGEETTPAALVEEIRAALRWAVPEIPTSSGGSSRRAGKRRKSRKRSRAPEVERGGVSSAAGPLEVEETGAGWEERHHFRTGGMELDAAAWEALNTRAPRKADRTAHALTAAWHLWRCGGRSWSEVAGVVMSAPALSRWRRGGRAAAARRWRMESRKWAAWRPRLAPEVEERIEGALAARRALAPEVEAVLVAVVERMRHAGRVEAVPVAVLDLVVWGVSTSSRSSSRLLGELESLGVLSRARRWEHGPAREATLWTLNPVESWQVEGLNPGDGQNCPTATHPPRAVPGVVTSPVWLGAPGLGHAARRVWEILGEVGPCSAARLADLLGVPVRSVRRWLESLASVGLVLRSAAGSSASWSCSGARLAGLEILGEALARWRRRVEEVRERRAAWRETLERAAGARESVEESPASFGLSAVLGEAAAAAVEAAGRVSRSRRSGRVMDPGEIFRAMSAAAVEAVRAGPVEVAAPPG